MGERPEHALRIGFVVGEGLENGADEETENGDVRYERPESFLYLPEP